MCYISFFYLFFTVYESISCFLCVNICIEEKFVNSFYLMKFSVVKVEFINTSNANVQIVACRKRYLSTSDTTLFGTRRTHIHIHSSLTFFTTIKLIELADAEAMGKFSYENIDANITAKKNYFSFTLHSEKKVIYDKNARMK